MELNHIYCGDSLGVLKDFTDKSIDCCVTSPPYYGLRDYGTGKWIGGDPDCKHEGNPIRTREHINENYGEGWKDIRNKLVLQPFKTVCPLCGAVREDKQIGLEETPEEYIQRLVSVFHEVKRVLKDDGTLWLNIGDSYAGSGKGAWDKKDIQKEVYVPDSDSPQSKMRKTWDGIKPKDMIGIPWMLAFALRADGWYLRQDIIWHKTNPMPESVKDRCVKSHEYIFLLSKSKKYYFDYEAIQEQSTSFNPNRTDGHRIGGNKYHQGLYKKEYKNLQYKRQPNHTMHERRAEGKSDAETPMRNKRDVWTVSTKPFKGAHFAVFPEALIEPCVLAGCPDGGVVLDPFFGSGTTGYVATKYNRKYVGIELNPKYIDIAKKRLGDVQMDLLAYL